VSATFPAQVDTATGAAAATLAGASLTPVSGALYLVAVANYLAAAGTPTLSGTGGFSVTWTQVATRAGAAASQRITVFRGVASSASAGVITADFGGVSQDQIRMVTLRCQTINQASAQGVVQSVSATLSPSALPTVTFAAFSAVLNVAVMFSMTDQNTTWTNSTPGWTPYTVIAGAGGSVGAMFRAHATLDVSPFGTFGASGITCSIGVEVKVDTASAGPGYAIKGAAPVDNSCYRTRFGGPLRGVQVSGESDFMPGGGGPTGYPVGDPAGINALETVQSENTAMSQLRGLWFHKTQRDDAAGSPSAPSQVQHGFGYLKQMLVPVTAGAWTIAIDCKMGTDPGASLRPQLVVKANPEVGLQNDLVVTATAGTAWQTLSAGWTATATGVVEVWRYKRDRDISEVRWDNLVAE
jgi:hypothetical protein